MNPIYDINRLDAEISCEQVVQILKDLNINPSQFFKVILNKVVEDEAHKRSLRRWFDQEILKKGGEKGGVSG